jgi:hypothetical protein
MFQIAPESRKFSALNGIARTNKKGKRTANAFLSLTFACNPGYSPRASILGFS